MARQEKRTARKDYPDQGIKAGDTYYFAQIKTGPRSSRTIRSLKPIPQSQLTSSPFKSGWFAMQEAWDASDKWIDDLESAIEAIQQLGEEASESFENMPEGLQQGDTGQMLEARRDACEEAVSALEEIKYRLEELEVPEEPESPDTEDGDEAYEIAMDEYKDACDDYTSELETAVEEADGIIGDMPE